MDIVTILGTRGSVPRAGKAFSRYGGDTTCVQVELAGENILLDAGTGLLNCTLPNGTAEKPIPLLLSHFHTDHLLGLPLSPLLMDHTNHIDIYAQDRDLLNTEDRLDRIFSPPLWPVRLKGLPAQVNYREFPETLQLGAVTVETIEGCHPDGVTLMKLIGGGHSVAFLSDCTLTEDIFPSLVDFARDCSLLLCDGQYSDEEWISRSSFGHSTWSLAVRLGLACGAERIRIIHHDPFHTDDMLEEAALRLSAMHPDCGFARAGEEIIL
jgi:phosphoribosyl 1,2-cyclic phosphodiesterase